MGRQADQPVEYNRHNTATWLSWSGRGLKSANHQWARAARGGRNKDINKAICANKETSVKLEKRLAEFPHQSIQTSGVLLFCGSYHTQQKHATLWVPSESHQKACIGDLKTRKDLGLSKNPSGSGQPPKGSQLRTINRNIQCPINNQE